MFTERDDWRVHSKSRWLRHVLQTGLGHIAVLPGRAARTESHSLYNVYGNGMELSIPGSSEVILESLSSPGSGSAP
jgi:hypothetical protein